MPLRRSPRRTAAFLAANRANAQKSTGPRTTTGKQRSAANALRTGKRASPAFWPRVLSQSELAEFYALRDVIQQAVSAGRESQKAVDTNTRLVWSVRRYAERYLRTLPPDARRQIANRLIPVPRFWHSAILGPGWKVTVTVFARRGRRRQCDMGTIPAMGPAERGHLCPHSVHVITRVTCTGHPRFNRGPEGVPLSTKPSSKAPEIRTNPEYLTKEKAYKNIVPNADSQRVSGPRAAAPPPALRKASALPTGRKKIDGLSSAPGKAEPFRKAGGRAASVTGSQGVDANAPPWEIPEGYRWMRTDGKG